MGRHTGPTEAMQVKMAAILRALKDGPLNGNELRKAAKLDKAEAMRALAHLRTGGKIRKTGERRSTTWHLANGVEVPRKLYTRANGATKDNSTKLTARRVTKAQEALAHTNGAPHAVSDKSKVLMARLVSALKRDGVNSVHVFINGTWKAEFSREESGTCA